jgi:peptidylprolyl isomerase
MRRRDLLVGSPVLTTTAALEPEAAEPENMLAIELATGRVLIEMRPDLAPETVERVKELAREHFYDNVVFHRVIPGFMAQTGDPTGTGRGGSSKPNLPAEFSQEPFKRGTVGMARAANRNSANSQFFICYVPASHLNGQYTVWGHVVEGMELVDALAPGEPPAHPDKMLKVRVLADVQ